MAGAGYFLDGAASARQGAAEGSDRVAEDQQPGYGGQVKGEAEDFDVNPRLEMQLWVQSDNPDYQKAVEERLAELRVKGEEAKREPIVSERARLGREWREAEERKERKRRKAERAELKAIEAAGKEEEAKRFRAKLRARNKLRLKKKNNVRAFAVRLSHFSEDKEQLLRDLFDGLLAFVPRERSESVLCASPPKEEGGLSDSEFWNGYEWERE